MELTFEPACRQWRELPGGSSAVRWGGRTLASWRRLTRDELRLDPDRPVIATGHQTLLWHPGILVKYLAVQAVVDASPEIAAADLIVDQHVSDFGGFDVPVRNDRGGLDTATIRLTTARPGVPMGRHPAFVPDPLPAFTPALESVGDGVERIHAAVTAHAGADNAAEQMAAALSDLMSAWVDPWPRVRSSDLMATSFTRVLLERMAERPRRCADAYNAAVAATPQAGIGPLAAGPGGVELPLWKTGADDRRRTADEADLRAWLDAGGEGPPLLPKALMLTLLVRLSMCDLFVHGTGGAVYDRAMERWLAGWLGLEPQPFAVASADLRLPLGGSGPALSIDAALRSARRVWHDPESAAGGSAPGSTKQRLLAEIDAAPRRSRERLDAFKRMHAALEALRRESEDAVGAADRAVADARRRAAEAPIADRRDWAFPLYPAEMITALGDATREQIGSSQVALGSRRCRGPA